MADAHPSVRASGSAELDAVAAAQQWLADRGVAVPPGAPPIVPSGRGRQVPESRPKSRIDVPGAPGSEASDADGDRVDPDQEARARAVVLRKLGAQARTRHELGQALRAKDVPTDVADQVLDRMEEVGLVDDATFAHDWVNSRQQRRQLSRRALGRELKERGVSPDQIADALAEVGSGQEYDSALELARRRKRPMSNLPREVVRRRLCGVLGRRGFSSSVINRVLAEVDAPGPGPD